MNGHKSQVSSVDLGKQLTSLIKIKMKKLNLEKLKLAAEDVLQRSQLAGIYGGSGSGDCLTMKCGTQHPGNSCCGGTTCSSITNGHCIRN
jgi:hypothetical protein